MIFFNSTASNKVATIQLNTIVHLFLFNVAMFFLVVAWEFIVEPFIFKNVTVSLITELELKWRFVIEITLFTILVTLILNTSRVRNVIFNNAATEKIAQELRQLIDTANAPIIAIDLHGRLNEWNNAAATITGFTREEVIGKHLVAEFIEEHYQHDVQQVLDDALNGKDTINYELTLLTKNKQHVLLLLNASSRQDLDGNIVGVLGVAQDITELKKTQAQIIQSSKLASLGEMATSISHELNQPLNTIRMAVSNIIDRTESGEISSDYLLDKLLRIEDQVERSSTIINNMRVFGRISNEELEPVNTKELLTSVMEMIGEQLKLENIEVITNCKMFSDPIVMGNSIQLQQVFLNLLTNARDAIVKNNAERTITLVGSANDNNQLEITFTDTGGGIAENVLPKIFEPFFTTKSMEKGTGLGLSISYGIIRDMNGTITAKNIDGGARFTITLPLIEDKTLADAAEPPRAVVNVDC